MTTTTTHRSGCNSNKDMIDWRNVQGKLYDKSQQIDQLVQAYQRQIHPAESSKIPNNHHELVVITGPSGAGKTALALTLQERVEENGGYFVRGKFEQPTNVGTTSAVSSAPCCCKVDTAVHGPFASAISQYASLLLTSRERRRSRHADLNDDENRYDDEQDELSLLQAALERELDTSEQQVLVESIPAIQPILAPNKIISQSNINSLPSMTRQHNINASTGWRGLQGPDAEKCFHHIVSKLVAAICAATSYHRPLVLLLDDLQWADPRAWGLLKAILTRQSSTSAKGLLVICTVRSDCHQLHEHQPHPPTGDQPQENVTTELLNASLEALKASGVLTTHVPVSNLCEEGVNEFVNDLLYPLIDDESQLVALSKALYRQTDGNVFFMLQLLRFWQAEGLFQQATHDEGQIRLSHSIIMGDDATAAATTSVLDLLVKKIQQLPWNVQEVLKMAACMGTNVSERLLKEAGSVGLSPLKVKPALLVAHEQQLIHYEASSGMIGFIHDVIQQAAYSLIPENTRAALHLHIGRALWVWLAYDELETHLFLVTNQITRGLHLLDDPIEQEEMAELFYRAGQKAAQASAFSKASDYYKTGIRLLGRKNWKYHYRLSLDLYNAAAEVDYYEGNLTRVDSLLSSVLKHAKSLDDKLHAHYTQIYSLASRDDLNKAFSVGFEVLMQLGVAFPYKLRTVRTRLAWHGCLQKLRRLTDDQIMNLPVMQDNRQLIIMRLLNTLMMSAFSARQELVLPILIRTVKRTLQYGICGASCIGLGYVGSHLGRLGHVEDGRRFVRLGLRIMEQFDAKEWQCRLALGVYSGFYTMRHPIRESIKPLLAARRAGLVVGDIHSSLVCATIQSRVSLCAAMPLQELLDDLRRCRRICLQYGQSNADETLKHQEQLCLNFMGKTQDPVTLTGDVMDEEEMLQSLQDKHPISVAWLLLMKHMLAVYYHDFQVAKSTAARLRALNVDAALLEVSLVTHQFLEGLTAAALSRTEKTDSRRAQRICKRLLFYQSISSENFTNKVCLLEAEIAALKGDQTVALSKYQESIHAAASQGFLHEQALACERAGQAVLDWGDERMGRDFLKQACSSYEAWGAHAKVLHIESRFPNLLFRDDK